MDYDAEERDKASARFRRNPHGMGLFGQAAMNALFVTVRAVHFASAILLFGERPSR